jgi:transcription elongation factor Elf1
MAEDTSGIPPLIPSRIFYFRNGPNTDGPNTDALGHHMNNTLSYGPVSNATLNMLERVLNGSNLHSLQVETDDDENANGQNVQTEEEIFNRILELSSVSDTQTGGFTELERENGNYNYLDTIVYTCSKCKHNYTSSELIKKKNKHEEMTCDECGDDELCILYEIINLCHIEMMNSYHGGSVSVKENENIAESMERNFKESASKASKKILEKLRSTYPIRQGANNNKECAVTMCDGECRLIRCCIKNNHYIHADCLLEHIFNSSVEFCPMCRDKYLIQMIYRVLGRNNVFHKLIFSCYGTFNTRVYVNDLITTLNGEKPQEQQSQQQIYDV